MPETHPPAVLVFVLCAGLHASREKGVSLLGLRNHLGFARLPRTIDLHAYFELRLPPGGHTVAIRVVEVDGGAVLDEAVRICEVGRDSNMKAGSVVLHLPFKRAGWYTASIMVGALCVERELCVLTPETRNDLEHREA